MRIGFAPIRPMAAALLLAVAALARPTAADAATCASLDAGVGYADFSSCVAKGAAELDSVAGVVADLFGDEGLSVEGAVLFERHGGRFDPNAGSVVFHRSDKRAATFFALPEATLFIALQAGDGFELFRTPDAGLADPFEAFTLRHDLGNNGRPLVTFFLGDVAGPADGVLANAPIGPTSAVPLPPTLWLMLAAVFGIAYLGRARQA